MKRSLFITFIIVAVASIMFAVALYVPNSLPVHSDFSAIYNTNLALVHRIPIYDLEKVEALAVQYAGIPADKFFLARFPYPPWYALSTFYLGLLPAKAAGTLWFELNLVMLFLSVWLLTDGWSGRLRLIAFPLSLFFLPVLGALSVGQYDFPVLLGTALLMYSIRRENVRLTVLGVVLLTFKPHIGALILLSALGWLIYNGGSFGRRVMRPLILVGVLLFIVGFIADPAWISSYPRMLLNYQSEGNVSGCSECASLPVWVSRWFFDGSLTNAAWIAAALLVVLIISLYFIRTSLRSHELLLSAALIITLLVIPYLYNYDFLLLLVPFAMFGSPAFTVRGAGFGGESVHTHALTSKSGDLPRKFPKSPKFVSKSSLAQKIIVIFCYLVPTFAIIQYGRDGNISLIVVSSMMMFLLYISAKKSVIDFSGHAA